MLLLIGILSFSRLSVREYPDIDSPTVSVRVVYAGASAEVIESQVTVPLEDALAGIEGVEDHGGGFPVGHEARESGLFFCDGEGLVALEDRGREVVTGVFRP
jgi:hypothetical protein